MSTTPAAGRRALVVSYAEVAQDPRVANQIKWLTRAGITVDTLGRGSAPAGLTGRHFSITRWPLVIRLLAYAVLPNSARFRFLVGSRIPSHISDGLDERYDIVVVNTIDLLPWFTVVSERLVKPDGVACLDLHEYSPSQGVGFLWKVLFRRYQNWLIGFIASPAFTSRITVAEGIAELYATNFAIDKPQVVRNVPPYVDQAPSSVDSANIRLIHHGKADSGRGLVLMIDALKLIDERFTLTLMLVGAADEIRLIHRQAQPLGSRVIFRDPVPVDRVAETLNEYDVELIFFPPVTENLRYALPNKFFEAVQGRLAVVIGDSPEMVRLVNEFGNGAIARAWDARALADTVNSLTAEAISRMKSGSHVAARSLSTESEGIRFLAALGVDDNA